MFTEDEADAIAVGVRLLARTGDPGLQKAAKSVLSKVTLVVPDPLRDYLTTAPVYVSKSGAPVPAQPDLPSTIRHAIRATRKIRIAYQDGDGRSTERVIQPFAVAYYTGATLICAWCELRNDVRHFRTDRVVSTDVLDGSFSIPETVATKWLAEHQDGEPIATRLRGGDVGAVRAPQGDPLCSRRETGGQLVEGFVRKPPLLDDTE